MLTRINLILLLIVVCTAVYLVHVQFQVRLLFIERYQVIRDWDKLQLQKNQLDVQERELSSSSRVQQIATEKLKMIHINPGMTLYFKNGVITTAGAAAPSTTSTSPPTLLPSKPTP